MNSRADELRKLCGRVFADLGRARVSPRQAMLFERVLRVTLARGRQAVRIVRFEVFGRFGLSNGNVSDCLNGCVREGRRVPGLIELRMLQVTDCADGGTIWTVLPDASQWACEWRFDRTADAGLLAELDAVAGQIQPELWPREPSLNDALAEVSADNAVKGMIPDARSQVGNEPERHCSQVGNEFAERIAAKRVTAPEVCTNRVPVPVVPGTCSPVSQASKAGKTGEQVTGTGTGASQERGPTEAAVLHRLQAWLAKSPFESDRTDFAHWSGYWRMKVVRPDPGLVDRALSDLESRGREGWEARTNRVAALKHLVKLFGEGGHKR